MSDRLEWLDELRGLAALMVMLIHYHMLLETPEGRSLFIESFARGVQLFYVLSGYILYKLYAAKVGNFAGYRQFILKRLFRIAPLFYLMILFGLAAPYHVIPDPIVNSVLHFLILPFVFFLNI